MSYPPLAVLIAQMPRPILLRAALIGCVTLGMAAHAQAFTFDLVSHTINSLTTAGSFAQPVAFTPDGRLVLFKTSLGTIAPTDTNDFEDFFLYDTQDKSIRLVTHTATSQTTASNGELFDPLRSLFNPIFLPGGRYLFFRTTATNMAGTDTNGVQDFFVYDIQDGSLDLVSHTATSLTTTANGGVGVGTYQGLSDDGRYILLDSTATNMTAADVNGTATDLYLYDTLDQNLALVSHAAGSLTTTTSDQIGSGFLAPDGAHVLFASNFPGNANVLPTNSAMLYSVADGSLLRLGSTNSQPTTFSPDGRYVFYSSSEVPSGQQDSNGPDLVVRDTQDGSDELVNHAFGSLTVASDEIASAGLLGTPNFAFSPDSRFIGFATGATNVAQVDTNGVEDLFLYDVTDRSVHPVSHVFGQNGTTGNAGPFGSPAGTGNGNRFSPNSRYLLFSSGSNNIAQSDANGSVDQFIYDTADGSVAPLTRAFGTAAATADGIATTALWSPDSRYVYFISSASNLVAPGVDTNADSDSFIYDTTDKSIHLVSHPVGSLTTAAGGLEFLAFSADSRRILLQTPRQNVAGSDPNIFDDIFIYDTLDQSLELVSHTANSLTTTGDGGAGSASFSPDGRFVLFESSATNIAGTNTNGFASDTFLYDVATEAVALVSQTASGTTGNFGTSAAPGFSPDGTHILISNQSNNLNGVTGTDSDFPSPDLFLTSVTTGAATGSVAIDDVAISEGDAGTKLATFTVSRSGGTAAFAIDYATANGPPVPASAVGTATVADGDYVAQSGMLSFAVGETSKTIDIVVNGDTKAELDEAFSVNLSGATNGATLADAQGRGVITNDDGAPPSGCNAGKMKCVDKKQGCLLLVQGTAAKQGAPPDAAKLQKCRDTFDGGTKGFATGCVGKLESKQDPTKPKTICSVPGDLATLEGQVDGFVADVVREIDPDFPTVGPPSPCDGGKETCVRKKVSCLLKIHQAAAKQGTPPDPVKLQRCRDAFDGGAKGFTKGCIGKLESKQDLNKPKTICSVTGDLATLEGRVDTFVTAVAREIKNTP